MSRTRRALLFAVLLAEGASCRTRPYDLLLDAAADSSDLASAIDLSTRPDLAQPDLTPPDDCPPEAKLVYVIDRDTQVLSSFRPDTLAFTDVAVLACPAPGGSMPGSMAVQRDGTAWVEYTDFLRANPLLFRVDVRTGACDSTPRTPMGAPNEFGMAIALDNNVETLYILESLTTTPNNELETMDLTTFTASSRGVVMGDGDLTGDANGHLFAFLPDWSGQDARVIDLDKSSGAPLQTWTLTALDGDRGDVAIAAWGGVLWLFAGQGTQNGATTVARLDPTSGQLTTAIADTGRHIVGAGVAPCE